VAINECKSHFLSSWRKKTVPIDNGLLLEDTMVSDNDVLQAILALPQKYRIVVHLYYYEEYKISEIAEILKIKETTIQTQLQRAREKLKNTLRRYFDYE
jgi:RNA polymerase sigma-70 factor (ECF subfamily)